MTLGLFTCLNPGISEQVCTPRSSIQLHQQPGFSLGAASGGSSTRPTPDYSPWPGGSWPSRGDSGAAGRRRWPKGPSIFPRRPLHGACPAPGMLPAWGRGFLKPQSIGRLLAAAVCVGKEKGGDGGETPFQPFFLSGNPGEVPNHQERGGWDALG